MSHTNASLVYIIGTYPLLTTTFIDREIEMLRKWGIAVQVVAMRRPAADTPFSASQQALQQGVIYLLPVAWLTLIAAHLTFLFTRPFTYLQTAVYLLTRPHPRPSAHVKTLLHFGQGVYTAYLLRKRPFLELHAHFVDRAATVALVAGRLLNKPYSLSIHAGADIFVDPVLLPEKVAEARHIATCTRYNITHVEGIVGRDLSSKITHINHGLDLDLYRPVPDPAPRPLILSVGQLAERKGFHHLIHACAELKRSGYDFTCRIIGRGPLHDALQADIHARGLDNTVFLCGALPHDDVIDWYRRATLFVLPCIQSQNGNLDGIPNVLAEAMAMRLPVVSTCVSAIPELVTDGTTGLLVPPADDAALTTALARLLDDPALRKTLGTNGRATVLNSFDITHNIHTFAATLWPEWID